jgi:hypothetical protein
MSESYIKTGVGGTMFAGPDATALFRAATLRSALGLLKAGISPTRGVTMTKALKMASEITGKKYKRTEADKAREDLKVWCDTMKAALPVIE